MCIGWTPCGYPLTTTRVGYLMWWNDEEKERRYLLSLNEDPAQMLVDELQMTLLRRSESWLALVFVAHFSPYRFSVWSEFGYVLADKDGPS